MGSSRTTKSYWPKVVEGRNFAKNLFFLDGDLHRLMHDHRGTNRLLSWNYPEHQSQVHLSSEVHKNKQNGFTTTAVCSLINRSKWHLWELVKHDMIERPQQTYSLDGRESPGIYVWSEDNVFELWDYFSKVHRGRPRRDGFVRPQALPTREALRAAMRNEEVLYVRNKAGDFVPVWDQGVYE